MSTFVDRLRDLDVPTAIIGGTPLADAPRAAQEPPQLARPVPSEAARPRVPEPPTALRIADLAPGEVVELWGR